MVATSNKSEYKEMIYSNQQWALFRAFRQKAIKIMTALEKANLRTFVHGSLARGDVSKESDIDVFIPTTPSSFIVENALERANFPLNARILIQATPNYAMKAYIEIDEKTNVSFPLMHMRSVERGFYEFGGEAKIVQLKSEIRVAGVNKKLLLIQPTVKGHIESSIIGLEESVANNLSISVETVRDRVQTLLRRNKVGRTGVFIKKELNINETFEMALKKLADTNPAVRRRMKLYHSSG
jgi:predicted nucleotidyltransferase